MYPLVTKFNLYTHKHMHTFYGIYALHVNVQGILLLHQTMLLFICLFMKRHQKQEKKHKEEDDKPSLAKPAVSLLLVHLFCFSSPIPNLL